MGLLRTFYHFELDFHGQIYVHYIFLSLLFRKYSDYMSSMNYPFYLYDYLLYDF